ncbi:MAG: class I SAM-dependent methyltransferase [Bryobacteraceae bacterium]|jgi:SAM-dependent methyltransferase
MNACNAPPPCSREWESVGSRPSPSWYLDRLVAAQKRRVHQELIWRWTHDLEVSRVLKTDVFEEAYGGDQILFDLFPGAALAIGMDVAWQTAQRAQAKCGNPRVGFLVSDVRSLGVRSESVDAVVSTSTLDHLDSREALVAALKELTCVLRPGGLAVVTIDNPENPLYALLRWASRRGWAPYPLGYTVSLSGLVRGLEAAGLEVLATDTLIHNPRLISTFLFLALRRLLGRRADGPIRALLAVFAALGRLPTRRFTACFVAACARKPAA